MLMAKMEVLAACVGLHLLLAHPPTTHPPPQARHAPAALHPKGRERTAPICLQLARASDSGVAGLVEAALKESTLLRAQLPPPLLLLRPSWLAVLQLLPIRTLRFHRLLAAGTKLSTPAPVANMPLSASGA